MISCPECESELDLEIDELEEGDVVSCDECGVEMEIVRLEPFEANVLFEDEDEDECDDEEELDEEEEDEDD